MEALNVEPSCDTCRYLCFGEECTACELARLRTLVGAQQQVIDVLMVKLAEASVAALGGSRKGAEVARG